MIPNQRYAIVAVWAAACLVACDAKQQQAASPGEEKAQATASGEEQAPRKTEPPKPYAMPDTPLVEALGLLAGAIDVSDFEDAEPPEKPLTWSAPPKGCALVYESLAQGEVSTEASSRAGVQSTTSHIDYYSEFWLEAGEGADLSVDTRAILVSKKGEGGEVVPAAVLPAGYAARTKLSIVNGALAEVDGPTSTWSSSGLYSGPVYFFPALPDHIASGHEKAREWTFVWHARGSGQRTEASRGMTRLPAGYDFMTPQPHSKPATTRIERWLASKSSGQRVALVSMKMNLDETPSPAFDAAKRRVLASTQGAVSGLFLIDTNGTLLAAHVDSSRDARLKGLDDPDANTRRVAKFGASARLVMRSGAGCEVKAPVAKSLQRERSQEERALLVWSKLRNTIVLEHLKKAQPLEPLFTAPVWEAHKDKIEPSLRAMVELHDANALGFLTMFRHVVDISSGDDLIEVKLTGESRMAGVDGKPTRVALTTRVSLRVVENQPRIERIRINKADDEAGEPIFEISPERILAPGK